MSGSPEHDIRADAILAPVDVKEDACTVVERIIRDRARDAEDEQNLLEAVGLRAYKSGANPKAEYKRNLRRKQRLERETSS